jgi:hypothetical protein
MTAADNERAPVPLSPRDLLTGELPGLLWYWTSSSTPEAARALLAAWAGLQRLERTGPDPDEDRLNALVLEEAARLVHAAGEGTIFDTEDWLRRAEELDRAQDTGSEDADELHWQAHDLFERLDRADLALWSLEKLGGPDQNADRLASARSALGQADAYLTSRTDLFLALALDVADVLSAIPMDLDEREPELWATLLRHRRIEEAQDDLEASPDRATLLASARSERVGTVRPASQAQARVTPDDRSPLLMQAAGTGPETGAPLHHLARASPMEAPTTDPGLALAHFLAATWLNTGLQESWRRAFLELEVPSEERRRLADLLACLQDLAGKCKEPTG